MCGGKGTGSHGQWGHDNKFSWGSCTVGVSSEDPHSLPVLSLHEYKWRPDMRWWKLVSDVKTNKQKSGPSAESTMKAALSFQVFFQEDLGCNPSQLSPAGVGSGWWELMELLWPRSLCPTGAKDSLRAGTLLCQGSFALTGLFFIPPYKSLFPLIQLLEKDYSLKIKSSRN